jgi:hypothetical protein
LFLFRLIREIRVISGESFVQDKINGNVDFTLIRGSSLIDSWLQFPAGLQDHPFSHGFL